MSGKITEHVKGKSQFVSFEDGQFWYQTDSGLQFGIPVGEVGEMTLNATEESTRLMRWIRVGWDYIQDEAKKYEEQPLATA